MSRWNMRDDVPRGSDYDERWRTLEEAGASVHGEADLIESLAAPIGRRVLDAGCGTGRVGIELARRGHEVVGVDLDPDMLDTARAKAPELDWVLADLVDVDLRTPDGGRRAFDVVALPGNVVIFLAPGSEDTVIANLARHLAPGGLLVAGFQTTTEHLDVSGYERACRRAGLEMVHRWSTWDRQPHGDDDTYVVSVHRSTK